MNEDDIEQMFVGIGSALNITNRIIAFGPIDRESEKIVVIDHALKAAYGMLQQIEPSEKKELS